MNTPIGDAAPTENANKRICSSCGAFIKEDAKVCTNCGAGKYPAGYKPKRVVTAILFWVFLGLLGGHRFYVGKVKTGILMLILFFLGSFGLFGGRQFYMLIPLVGLGIWWLIDFVLIFCGFVKDKNGYELK
jgi:TM2 domain-containing membrane protein YozV/ribosomal protein L40E